MTDTEDSNTTHCKSTFRLMNLIYLNYITYKYDNIVTARTFIQERSAKIRVNKIPIIFRVDDTPSSTAVRSVSKFQLSSSFLINIKTCQLPSSCNQRFYICKSA